MPLINAQASFISNYLQMMIKFFFIDIEILQSQDWLTVRIEKHRSTAHLANRSQFAQRYP